MPLNQSYLYLSQLYSSAKESMSSAVSEPVIFPPHTPETKHGSVTRPQPKTAEPKIPEPKILEPKIPEPKIPQPKKPEPEKAESEKREPEKPADKDEEVNTSHAVVLFEKKVSSEPWALSISICLLNQSVTPSNEGLV